MKKIIFTLLFLTVSFSAFASLARLDQEIKAAGIPIYGVSGEQGSVRVDYMPSATDQQKADAQTIVDNFDWSADALTDIKKAKNDAIDAKTASLLSSGFTYNSKTFDLSDQARTNWIGLYTGRDLLTYPFTITTADGGSYDLADATDLTQFFGAGLSRVKQIYDGARTLKEQVTAATDAAAVNAITDDRT